VYLWSLNAYPDENTIIKKKRNINTPRVPIVRVIPLSSKMVTTIMNNGIIWCGHLSMLCFCVGVADGVGGWRTYGVDPSQFPKSLMAACERMVHSGQFTPRCPVDVLSSGYQEIQQDKAPLIGSFCLYFRKLVKILTMPYPTQFRLFLMQCWQQSFNWYWQCNHHKAI